MPSEDTILRAALQMISCCCLLAGVIIFRNTPITLEFLAEWREWLTNPEHETATVGESCLKQYAVCCSTVEVEHCEEAASALYACASYSHITRVFAFRHGR